MIEEERIVRDSLAQWATLEGTIAAFRRYHREFTWWNSARGLLGGLEDCIRGVETMHALLGVGRVDVIVRRVMAVPGCVMVERSDDLYRADGSVIAQVPVVGIFEFKEGRIIALRDYCDDWMRDYRSEDASRALA